MHFPKKIQHWHVVTAYLALYDFFTVVLSYFLALWFRYDCSYNTIAEEFLDYYFKTIFFYVVFALIIYYICGLYRSIWRFASFYELKNSIISCVITAGIYAFFVTAFIHRMPISYYVFGFGFQLLFCIAIRFTYRFILLLRENRAKPRDSRNILLIGAGSAGRMILRDVNFVNDNNAKVVAIIDDNPNKWTRYIDGIQVVGGRDKILSVVDEYQIDEIYIAIASVAPSVKRDLIAICQEAHCSIKQLPNIYSEKAGVITASNLQNITIEDVLGRDPIALDQQDVALQLKDKVVLVTGGGGSIGSELCRQIASYKPKQLIIFDVYENNAYEIQLELKRRFPELDLVTLIGSVRDSRRIEQLFDTYRPNICYHAAAHKHVPLMEDSPCEAIKNNVIGTYKTAHAAMEFGCDKFVLISTDKAVNPTNVMGASKRMCEMVVQVFDKKVRQKKCQDLLHLASTEYTDKYEANKVSEPATEYVAVRFGNVLGSNGSVVPLFKKQIAAGGPVTVTHPDIIRYFMTIPEAVSLVLKSGCKARGGEIFVLDMGEPVKIDDLARNMISLAGYKPDIDIEVRYTGLRPGEKLFEERLMAEEGLTRTEDDLISVAKPLEIDSASFIDQLKYIMGLAYDNDEKQVFEMVRQIVTTFKG